MADLHLITGRSYTLQGGTHFAIDATSHFQTTFSYCRLRGRRARGDDYGSSRLTAHTAF